MFQGNDSSRVTQPYTQKGAAQYPSNPKAPYKTPTLIATPQEHERYPASQHWNGSRPPQDNGYTNRGGGGGGRASGSGSGSGSGSRNNFGRNGNGSGNGSRYQGGYASTSRAPAYDDDDAAPIRSGHGSSSYGVGFNNSPAPWTQQNAPAASPQDYEMRDKAVREALLATEDARKLHALQLKAQDKDKRIEKKRLVMENDQQIRAKEKAERERKDLASSSGVRADVASSSSPADAPKPDKNQPFDLTSSKVGKHTSTEAFYSGKSSLPTARRDPAAVARRQAAAAAAAPESRRQPPKPNKSNARKVVTVDSDEDEGEEDVASTTRKRTIVDSDDDEPVKEQKKKVKLAGKDDRSKTGKSDHHSKKGKADRSDKGKGKGKARELSVEHLTIESSPEKPTKPRSLAEHFADKAARKAERRAAKSAFHLDSDSDAGSSSSDSDEAKAVPHFVDPDDDELEAMLKAHREKVGRGGTPDALLESDDDERPKGPLCPFCAAPMPDQPSKRLLDLEHYLRTRPHATKNPTRKNPNGVRLPVVETASFCRKHDEEREIIPAGREKGWPESIEWNQLDARICKASEHLTKVLFKLVPSDFLDAARAEWEAKGSRKMANVLSEWGSFDVEMPGYYGPRGLEAMITSLRKYLDVHPRQTTPLSVEAYLRRVLVPELTVMLIAEDLKVDLATARQTAIDSRAYGKAVFATSEEDDKWAAAEEKREKKEAKRRERKQVEQDELDAAEERRERKRRLDAVAEQGAKDAFANAIRVSKKLGDKTMDVNKPAMRVPKRRLEAQAAAAAAAKRNDDDTSDDDDDAMKRIIALSKSKPPRLEKPAPAPAKKKAAVTIDISDGSDDD